VDLVAQAEPIVQYLDRKEIKDLRDLSGLEVFKDLRAVQDRPDLAALQELIVLSPDLRDHKVFKVMLVPQDRPEQQR
jgi:hypothetical protein